MDDLSYYDQLRFLLPKLPLLLRTAALHLLGLSATSAKRALRTELIVAVLRCLLAAPHASVTRQQRSSAASEQPVKPYMWVARTTFPAPPEPDVRDALVRACGELAPAPAPATKEKDSGGGDGGGGVECVAVSGEWTAARLDRGDSQSSSSLPVPPAELSEKETFSAMQTALSTPVTILYFHGGAHYMCDPGTHRVPVYRLARRSGGRALSIRYRLSPQHPFPAALLDALVAYLALLYPPPDALHAPVRAEQVVLAGDSAGGNLVFALLLLLLHFRRSTAADGTTPSGPPLSFHGHSIPSLSSIPLPAAIAANSPWLDLTRCMPSTVANLPYDYLPSPAASSALTLPPCDAWPARPPRAELYCTAAQLRHPLVSPLAADIAAWAGAPPVYMLVGQELLTDEAAVVAARLARADSAGPVVWEQWEAMPHCFALLLGSAPETRRAFDSWAAFCRHAVVSPETLSSSGVWVASPSGKMTTVPVGGLKIPSDDVVEQLMLSAEQAKSAELRKLLEPSSKL